MSKLLDYTTEILLAGVTIFFFWGVGYLVFTADVRMEKLQQECIKAGMQWISGDCIR